MSKYFVITWRCPGGKVYFFRGDSRYEIFLPYISAKTVSRGWVHEEKYARVFDAYPVFAITSFAKNFIADRLRIFPYEKEILPTQVVRPIRRPRRNPPW